MPPGLSDFANHGFGKLADHSGEIFPPSHT
jgi:hypothetical protein